jgi:hypothetical protein
MYNGMVSVRNCFGYLKFLVDTLGWKRRTQKAWWKLGTKWHWWTAKIHIVTILEIMDHVYLESNRSNGMKMAPIAPYRCQLAPDWFKVALIKLSNP